MPKEDKKDTKQPPKVDFDTMSQWNNYADWLKDKGYAGKPEMNHADYSNNVFSQYKKEHPETTLTPEHFLPIQQEIHKYRESFINQLKNNKAQLVPGEQVKPDYSNVMSWGGTELGKKDDGIVGQYTSQFKFPSVYMNDIKPANRMGFVGQVDVATPSQAALGLNKNSPQLQAMQTGQGLFYGGKRVAELIPNGKDRSRILFRNEFGSTGEEAEIPNTDIQKYVGTTNSFQSQDLYNQLKGQKKVVAAN